MLVFEDQQPLLLMQGPQGALKIYIAAACLALLHLMLYGV